MSVENDDFNYGWFEDMSKDWPSKQKMIPPSSDCNCPTDPGTYEMNRAAINPWTGSNIGIDACVYLEVLGLWSKGIRTMSCCCGHGEAEGTIVVHENHIESMRELGYKHSHHMNCHEFTTKLFHI